MKFPTQNLLKKYPHKKVAGKPVYFMSNKNIPSMSIVKQVYEKINDDRRIPLVFQTKKQYVKDYIRNQEAVRNYDFSPRQERQFMNNELQNMSGVVSRYTTKSNRYIEPRTIVFTDNKLSPINLKAVLLHEYEHERIERQGKKYPRAVEERKANQFAWNYLKKKKGEK